MVVFQCFSVFFRSVMSCATIDTDHTRGKADLNRLVIIDLWYFLSYNRLKKGYMSTFTFNHWLLNCWNLNQNFGFSGLSSSCKRFCIKFELHPWRCIFFFINANNTLCYSTNILIYIKLFILVQNNSKLIMYILYILLYIVYI